VTARRSWPHRTETATGLCQHGPMPEILSTFVADMATREIDERVRGLARLHVLDTLASAVACRDLEPSVVGRRYATAHSGGQGVTVLGTHETAAPADAVLASAMAAHGAEINDFIPSVFVQPGPAVVSVALALAEQRGL